MGAGPNDPARCYHLTQALEASLRRLNTDRVDIYFYHKPDYATPIEAPCVRWKTLVRGRCPIAC
jgi:aryl-alcohol dehydrogenase-like predicted oxidoreductase